MDHLDRLFPNAVETIDVTVDSGLLRLASKFMQEGKADQAAVKEILNMVKGVYVKGVEFEQDNQFTTQDVETLRQQLQAPGWSRIVGVRSKRDGENVEVFMMHNGDIIQGIGVLLSDPKKLMSSTSSARSIPKRSASWWAASASPTLISIGAAPPSKPSAVTPTELCDCPSLRPYETTPDQSEGCFVCAAREH
jgi:hypothetical protein